jgi:hypothetical protein
MRTGVIDSCNSKERWEIFGLRLRNREKKPLMFRIEWGGNIARTAT